MLNFTLFQGDPLVQECIKKISIKITKQPENEEDMRLAEISNQLEKRKVNCKVITIDPNVLNIGQYKTNDGEIDVFYVSEYMNIAQRGNTRFILKDQNSTKQIVATLSYGSITPGTQLGLDIRACTSIENIEKTIRTKEVSENNHTP